METMLVLGIESSCDETAAAVVDNGRKILSSVISSQIEIHREWGGVVPEIASREHLLKIDPVVSEALDRSGVSIQDIDAIAVTNGPGLVGSLLVGVNYAKALALGLGIPFIGVNHIEGHFFSVVFENPPIEYPAMALIVSGGHTNLFFAPEAGKYELLSRTRDDAAGEAFDKVAKMLGLGYPGGPVIEKIAKQGDPKAIRFPIAKISDGTPDFSFSGLKTAVVNYLRENEIEPISAGEEPGKDVRDVCASFQDTVVRTLLKNTSKLAKERKPRVLIVAGGVACNEALRTASMRLGEKLGIPVYFPSRHLSTDNAAMIAAAGHFHLMRGERSDAGLKADVGIRLQNHRISPERSGKNLPYKV
ncbi:MAG: tRNA (adenosine(37)-N6)-threonylcarbamoyltransferase complex transferase subunit TsaD [Acidobacteria bacterium]|nr:MAG: tRNA (adenosine(37)-N6)-threonylcarbamoyltransferase complex transferase subunit TsaD [Acidobacteriota bacterium]REJ99347.1 MAG: tRNA (adenosine(37)-N6)-threonylcarbamoyltransferase complex transferase subunit TsaD [Acidobacteriota bacterium]REK16483.1 MAG: tRNA (adenosine(37)-N6)-threonylcarbamoyltransferase complex transferase subunit TsaD [Acidobacteriota bacterium]REK44165.1 MAG: tRNA (adenosine(37)-N6)-threonylcarbamoyltransferase complex transferase subunit TsaD [Acidobacteriota ba